MGNRQTAERRQGWMLFALLFLTFAFFANVRAPGWNVNSRLALTFAIVEQGTFSIDDYHDKPWLATNDKAYFNGRFYCDKSPGQSFLAVPLYWLLWRAKMDLGWWRHLPQPQWVQLSNYLLTLFTTGIASALAGILIWLLGRRFGASSGLAMALALALMLGTLLFAYATLFFAYMTAMACFLGSYYLLLAGRLDAGQAPVYGRGPRLFLAGLLLGMAWFLDYTVGLLGIGLGAYALWHLRSRPWPIWKFLLGGLIPVGLLFAYFHSIFGAFSIPYQYEYDPFFREQMAQGFQGIHWPSLTVLYYITIHPFRGLFVYSPFLLLWFAGLASGMRRFPRFRADVALSLYIVAAYFAFSAGYYMWWGGWAPGNRHISPAIPFFLAPMIFWLIDAKRWRVRLFALLLSVSVAMHLVVTAVDPQPRPNVHQTTLLNPHITHNYRSPIFQDTFPAFAAGDLGLNLGSVLLRLPGLLSLLPLAGLWMGFGWWAFSRTRRKDQPSSA